MHNSFLQNQIYILDFAKRKYEVIAVKSLLAWFFVNVISRDCNFFTFFDVLLYSEEEKDIVEIETALYYTPRLEEVILSKFRLEKYRVFFKIKVLDVVKLLQAMKKLVANNSWYSSLQVCTQDFAIENFHEAL